MPSRHITSPKGIPLARGEANRLRVLAQFASLTGNRRAEFLKLHWPAVDDHIIRLTRAKQHGGQLGPVE